MDLPRDLYQGLASIGMNVSTSKKIQPFTDVERTLLSATQKIGEDSRLLSLLLSWVHIHGEKLNIERLKKLEKKNPSPWLGLLASFGVFSKQTRWKTLVSRSEILIANGSLESAKNRISFKGEEEWSKGTGFLIAKGSEPVNRKWVLPPERFALINRHYHNKLVYGSNWRADIVTAFEAGARTPTEIAKMCGSSYEPAHRVYQDLLAAGVLEKLAG